MNRELQRYCKRSAVSPDSAVSGLLFLCRPSHIARLVMTVVHFAIQTVLRTWAATNAFQKLRKGIEAEFNAASAVAFEIVTAGIGASLLGICVRDVLRRDSIITGVAMDVFYLNNNFLAKAAARFCVAITQISRRALSGVTALAKAVPTMNRIDIGTGICCSRYYEQSPEFLTDQISHRRSILSHVFAM